MKNYELACIFKQGADFAAMKEKVDGLLKEISAKPGAVEDWGMKRMAYPIGKESEGYYYFIKFSADPGLVQSIKRTLSLDQGMLRYMLLLDEIWIAPKDDKRKPVSSAMRPPRRHYQNSPQ